MFSRLMITAVLAASLGACGGGGTSGSSTDLETSARPEAAEDATAQAAATPSRQTAQREGALETRIANLGSKALNGQVAAGPEPQPVRFAPPTELSPGLNVFPLAAMAIGDVNGDARADVVMSAYSSTEPPGTYKLLVYLQQPDGTLSPPVSVETRAAGCFPASLAIGDVDGDGRNDVVVAETGCGIEILRQTTGGTLVQGDFIASPQSDKVRLIDFSGDGRLDMVAIGPNDSMARVWRQSATGTMELFATPLVQTGFFPDLDVGDVNGDGLADFVLTTRQGGTPAAIVLQQADGSFAPPVYLTADTDRDAVGIAVGDVNGDGRQDIVVTFLGNSPIYIGVFYQGLDGSMGMMAKLSSYDIPWQVEAADVNNDGRADVVVAHSGWAAVGVYLQQPDGSLAAEVRYPGPYGNSNPHSMAVGDISGDGRRDVVIAGYALRQLADEDTSPPVVSYSGNSGFYTVDQTVNIVCTATDSGSGIASTTCTNVSGTAYTFTLGNNTFSATATDVAGNVGAATTSFTVAVTTASMVNLTNRFVTHRFVEIWLDVKLKLAAAAGDRGNLRAKATLIAAYVADLRHLSGKAISATDAEILIRLAAAL